MLSMPDFSLHRQGRRTASAARTLSAVLVAVLLAACTGTPEKNTESPPPAEQAVAPLPAPPIRPVPSTPPLVTATSSTPAPVAPSPLPALLLQAERLRQMTPPELNLEIARLGDGRTPAEQIQLSMALSQLRQLPDVIRAQELLTRVLANPDAAALHPLARLLASRYVEQRRLEEQIERQAQQLRDTQRRLEQTNDRLEALKAIERSLVSRPPASGASAPAPTGRRGSTTTTAPRTAP